MKRSILIFREGLVHRCDFGDDDELRQNLLHLVNHVLGLARDTIDNMNRQGSVDYGKVLRESFSGPYMTHMTDILVYYYGHNPFLGFEWNNPIPNSKFRAKHTNPDEWGIGVRGIHIHNKNFPK